MNADFGYQGVNIISLRRIIDVSSAVRGVLPNHMLQEISASSSRGRNWYQVPKERRCESLAFLFQAPAQKDGLPTGGASRVTVGCGLLPMPLRIHRNL